MYIHREFSHESVGERIMKIGPHLPTLLSNIKGCTFFGTHCTCDFIRTLRRSVSRYKLYECCICVQQRMKGNVRGTAEDE